MSLLSFSSLTNKVSKGIGMEPLLSVSKVESLGGLYCTAGDDEVFRNLEDRIISNGIWDSLEF